MNIWFHRSRVITGPINKVSSPTTVGQVPYRYTFQGSFILGRIMHLTRETLPTVYEDMTYFLSTSTDGYFGYRGFIGGY